MSSAPGSGAEITELGAAAYCVPTEVPESDGTSSWSSTTIVVVTARAAGCVGLGYTYAHRACADVVDTSLAPVVRGCDALDAPAVWQRMQESIRNDGRPGLVSCAMSAADIAVRDAAARACGLPLSRYLGRARESVAVYGSGGFTSYDRGQLQRQLLRWTAEQELGAVKINVGEGWGGAVERDLHRVRLARTAVGPDVAVFVDANGAYSAGQAVRVGQRLDELGVVWFEEPVSSDDLPGLRRVLTSTLADVTAGEHGYDLPYFANMLQAGAVDCLQVDLTRCGGIGE